MEKRVTKNQKHAQEQALKKQRNRLVAGIILIAAALVIAAGGVLLFLQEQKKTDAVPDTSDYEQVLQSYYDALVSADGKTMAQITAPPEYWPYYLETYDKTEADVEASFQESCQEKMSDWQSVYGSDVTISYRIVGLSQPDENGLDKVEAMKHTYHKLNLDCLVILGGNGTQKTANLLREEGLNVVHLPKTIDNDIYGTDVTFGFQSAINIATEAIDCIHTTAASHNRIFIVEVMGHKVGWLTLYAGVASGADIILLPEIPYDIDSVLGAIEKRSKAGKGFTILAVAEGAISKEDAKLSKKEYKEKLKNYKFPSVSYELADMIEKKSGAEVRVVVPGHTQRGGSPCPYDRVLCSRLGAAAAQAIMDEDYGNMIAMVNGKTKRVPLGDVAGKLKSVDPECQMIKEAKSMGISFGD